MNGTALRETGEELEQIAQLRERVSALEIRLARLEQGIAVALPAAELPAESVEASAAAQVHTAAVSTRTGPPIDTEVAAATIFRRIAMLCFVLLGALILRVLTQQNILGAGFGTVLGFAYAGHLIVLAFIPGRFGAFARESSLFQCSGAVLAFVIAIEAALRTSAMGRVPAMITIAGFALFAVGMGIHQRRPALGGTGVIGGVLALVALDMKGATVSLQLALVVLLAAAGIANSWRDGWKWLRPMTTLLMLGLLPAGFFFCGQEPGVARGLVAASAAVWCVVAGQHLLAFRRLRKGAAWLPLTSLWFAGIQHLGGWPFIGTTVGGIAVFALAGVVLGTRYAGSATAALAGLTATSAVAGAIGWALLDRTGLLCAVGGLALWFAGRRAAPDWAAVFATLLMVAAAAVGLAQLLHPPVAVRGLTAMALSAVVLVFHYVRNSRTGTEPYSGRAMRLAPVALAAGLGLLLGVFHELLNRWFAQPAQLLLSQTVVVVVTGLALTFWGHVAHRRSPLFCGLACMLLALTKVLVVDLVRLKSVNMLASLVLVGLACVAVSIILRRRV